jgi:hydrogenase maturation protease
MTIKLVAIGNRFMSDDGVAIHIAEKLVKELETEGMEVIIGETDFHYCLSKIEEGDFVIILDATWLGVKPGMVTSNSLEKIEGLNLNQGLFSQHGYSLIRALRTYYKSIKGIVIGIEGRNFDFGFTLSHEIEENFQDICNQVKDLFLYQLS